MLDRVVGGITGGITGGIGGLLGGIRDGYNEKDYRRGRYGYGYEEHKEFESHVQTDGGYSDRQTRYKHHTNLPTNHSRRPMNHHMLPRSDVDEEFYESRQSHHTSAYGNNNHHNGKMGNGWQGQHEDAYHGGHGMQQQNRLMAPQVPTRHVYMNPVQDGRYQY
ncbi:hypothetical protein CARUB_v10021067mg [Capsella rubella]|uniref:Uncharacterized protein n=1 Tax=Capsella rubella TaxID=81985 RepID=R0GIW3_9BRAS|nr:uncharacterized protein LOC17895378 [Capsella rubella]EOA35827.1 hypothetical protein CARUB_v10021067mg [Capsella rubella]